MILSVTLKNWKSHGDGENGEGNKIVFEPGLNVIYGVNGSGKSSVVEAIAYALFGENVRFGNVLREGKQSGKVEVVFTVGNDVFRVKREFTKSGTVSAILLDDKGKPLEIAKSKEVTKKIEKLLGIDSKLFFKAIYGAQNKITELFDETGQKRAELFDKILGMEELSKARQVLKRIQNLVEAELRGLRVVELELEKKKLEEERDELLERTTKLLTEEQKIIKKLEKLESMLTSMGEKLSEAERKYRKLLELREKEKELEGKLDTISRQIKFYDVDESVTEELAIAEKRLKRAESLEREKGALLSRIELLKREMKRLPEEEPPSPQPIERELSELEKRRRSLEELLSSLENKERELIKTREQILRILRRREEINDELEVIRKEKEILKRELAKEGKIQSKLEDTKRLLEKTVAELGFLERIEGIKEMERCPVCETPLSEEKRKEIIKRGERKRSELMNIKQKLHKEIRTLEELKREIEKIAGRLGELERREKMLREELETLTKPEIGPVEKELLEVRKKIEGYKEEIRKLIEAEKKAVEKLNEIKRLIDLWNRRKALAEELKRLEDQVVRVEEELKRLGGLEELRLSVEELKEKMRSFQLLKEKEKIEKEMLIVQKQIMDLKNAEEEYKKVREDYETLSAEIGREKVRLEGTKKLLEEISERLKKTEESLKGVVEGIRRAQHLKKWKEILAKLLEAWVATVSEVRKMRMEAVNRALKLVWKRVYMARYSDYRDIELTQRETRGGHTYELLLKGERGWREVEKLSGGERTLALLALRIAVSYLLSGRASFLILDEPTHNLDADLSRQFAAFLKEATTEEPLFSQIIVITHNPVFADEADVVYRFEREKTGNDPTRVVREK